MILFKYLLNISLRQGILIDLRKVTFAQGPRGKAHTYTGQEREIPGGVTEEWAGSAPEKDPVVKAIRSLDTDKAYCSCYQRCSDLNGHPSSKGKLQSGSQNGPQEGNGFREWRNHLEQPHRKKQQVS